MPRWRWLAAMAAVSGLLAVGLAALGAHAIPLPDAAAGRTWGTALEMHLFHTTTLFGIALLAARVPEPAIFHSGLAMVLGTALFSGTLYLRAAGQDWFPSFLAPTGGMLLIAAWLWLAVILLMKNKD